MNTIRRDIDLAHRVPAYAMTAALVVLTCCICACSKDDTRGPDAPPPVSDMTQDMPADLSVRDAKDDLEDAFAEVDLRELPTDQGEVDTRPDLLDPDALITEEEILAAVDPFIGTGGLGFGFAALTPAAQHPFGLVKLGPDTTTSGSHGAQQHMGGYNDADPHVRGFSHLHFVGTGVADYGNLRVYPSRTLDRVGGRAWYATADRTREDASPGFYTTYLEEPAVKVELTASLRGAAHRYTFDAPEEPVYLALDAASSVTDSGVEQVVVSVDADQGVASGWVLYDGPYVGRGQAFKLYFVAKPSVAPERAFIWGDEGVDEVATTLDEGEGAKKGGAVFAWESPPSEPIELRVGVSLIDIESASAHLEQEVALETSFEALVEEAERAWLERLSTVRVAGGTFEERTIFYTALYNAFRMPTRFDDHQGRYLGLDGEIHDATHPYYTDLSLWDSFRTTHPLYGLIAKDVQRDVLSSLLAMQRDGGVLPRWPAAASYTGGMVGSSADMLFGESAAKNLDGIDWGEALDAVLIAADGEVPEGALGDGRPGVEHYIASGYVAAEQSSGPASVTLEYAYNDWAIHFLAKAAGEEAIAQRFLERSRSFQHTFDSETMFFRGKRMDGSFVEEFDLRVVEDRSGANFVEGSAWHYRFYALQDIEGLIELLGGIMSFTEALTTLFEESTFGDGLLGRHFLPEPYYWHGNQPPLHSVSLFAFSQTPEVQYTMLEKIRREYYSVRPDGIPGNDDGGTLSSWYVFHALGFYPVAGSDQFILGSPIFTRAEVKLDDTHTLTIEAPNTAPWQRVVEEHRVNGAPRLPSERLLDAELTNSTLTFDIRAEE